MTKRKKDLSQIILIYTGVAFIGFITAEISTGQPIIRAGIANLAMTVSIFIVSIWKKNSSAYDAYWSIIPSFLTIWLFFEPNTQPWGIWHWASMLMVNLWSWRLSYNWAKGWSGWAHEDWRYIELKAKHGSLYPIINFFGIHLFPTIIVFLSSLSLFFIAETSNFSATLMMIGLSIGLLGILIESVADAQLHKFRNRPDRMEETGRELLDTGLWRIIRYPNYLGEIMFWWGVAALGLGAGGHWWLIIGAISMVGLFGFVSIPMKNKHMQQRYPEFDDYRSRTRAFLPWKNPLSKV